MYEYLITGVLAFLISFTATPAVRKLAFKIGAVDIPKDDRRMHKKPTALLGGLAIIFGFAVSLLFGRFGLSFEMPELFPTGWKVFGLSFGVFLIVTIGIIDDIKPLGAKLKLLVQIVAAFTVAFSGIRIEFVTNPFSSIGISFFNVYVSYVLTVIWIVGITNAVNFIDGLDGLAAGVSSIASLSLFFVSVITMKWDMAIVTAALSGATLGFLPFNFNPAKIFMGDTGATFLGFLLAAISVQGTLKSYTTIAIAIPLLVLGLPLFDTIFAILRRLINKRPIMEGDRGHLHHRLIDMGLSQRQSVIIMYILSSTLGLCAIVLADKGALSAIILVILVSIFVVAGAKYTSEIGDEKDNAIETYDDSNKVIKEEKNKDSDNSES